MYDGGTFCEAPHSKFRKSNLKFKCSKSGSFFEVESIKEEEVCEYSIVIGTSLFCPFKDNPKNKDFSIYDLMCETK